MAECTHCGRETILGRVTCWACGAWVNRLEPTALDPAKIDLELLAEAKAILAADPDHQEWLRRQEDMERLRRLLG